MSYIYLMYAKRRKVDLAALLLHPMNTSMCRLQRKLKPAYQLGIALYVHEEYIPQE